MVTVKASATRNAAGRNVRTYISPQVLLAQPSAQTVVPARAAKVAASICAALATACKGKDVKARWATPSANRPVVAMPKAPRVAIASCAAKAAGIDSPAELSSLSLSGRPSEYNQPQLAGCLQWQQHLCLMPMLRMQPGVGPPAELSSIPPQHRPKSPENFGWMEMTPSPSPMRQPRHSLEYKLLQPTCCLQQ